MKKEIVSRLLHLQARTRRYLPSWAGGRFKAHEVSHKVFDDNDAAALLSFYEIPSTPATCERYEAMLRDESQLGLGIYVDDDLVAARWISRQWEGLGIPGYWFGGARVRPGLRGRGLGQILNHYCFVEAERLGINQVHGNVRIDNAPSLGALTASGFSRISKPEWERKLWNQLGEEQVILISPSLGPKLE